MNSQPENHELSRQTVKDLRALGGIQAPSELWSRVQAERDLQALGKAQAPEELWQRVQAELGGIHQSPASATAETQSQPQGRVLRGLFGAKRLTAAAAVLVLGGLALLSESPKSLPAEDGLLLASATPESVRAAYRAKLQVVDGDPSEMSMVAKGLAGTLGGSMVEDDA